MNTLAFNSQNFGRELRAKGGADQRRCFIGILAECAWPVCDCARSAKSFYA
jgi:hypothetical protein